MTHLAVPILFCLQWSIHRFLSFEAINRNVLNIISVCIAGILLLPTDG